MKRKYSIPLSKYMLMVIFLFFSGYLFAQQQAVVPKAKNEFWKKVQFGGGIGLSIGSGYTDISLAPSAVYNVNPYLGVGLGLQGTYVSSKGNYDSGIYGASILTYINPIPQIQFSIDLNESLVNNNYQTIGGDIYSDNFWNTALFFGAGYRNGNVTVGIAYNVLFDESDNVYGDAVTPFVRAYF